MIASSPEGAHRELFSSNLTLAKGKQQPLGKREQMNYAMPVA